MALAPLRAFGLQSVVLTTLQALSGAGYPGVASLDAVANVIPFIDGEEAKIESETQKILGTLAGDHIEPHPVASARQTTRVPVVNGHTESIAVRARVAAVDRRRARRRSCASAARRSGMGCRRRRCSRSSTFTSRTVPSRGWTSIAMTA